MSRGARATMMGDVGTPGKKTPSKKFEKPLDTTAEKWYNQGVERETKQQLLRVIV